MTTLRQINLSEELCAQAEKKFGAHFESLEALLDFVLRELLHDEAEKLDEQEKKILEQRLRDLGYL